MKVYVQYIPHIILGNYYFYYYYFFITPNILIINFIYRHNGRGNDGRFLTVRRQTENSVIRASVISRR